MHTCTHKEDTVVPKCGQREEHRARSQDKARASKRRPLHRKVGGEKSGGPSNAPRFSFILPESIPIGYSQEGL